ncbi:MAG: DUF6491 family protein [Pseudomonadota bacterium]
MQISTLGLVAASVGCATAPETPLDPAKDPRIGAEVTRACFVQAPSRSGGYIRIGDRDAYLSGDFDERSLLIFSRGCGDIRTGGAVPVFRGAGDSCRRRGDLVTTAQRSYPVTGSCTIRQIFKWSEEEEEISGSDDALETDDD